MIITVTRIVISGEKRVEEIATAQIQRSSSEIKGDTITETAEALFNSLNPPTK